MISKFLLMSGVFLSSLAYSKPVAVKSSSVIFTATGNPGFLTIEGYGGVLSSLDLSEDKGIVKGRVTVDLRLFTTDMDTRDSHMHKKYLESSQFPRAVLEFKGKNGKFKGMLTLKKVTKSVGGNYKLVDKKLEASFIVNLKDFPIGIPSWLGVTVAETVKIEVKAEL